MKKKLLTILFPVLFTLVCVFGVWANEQSVAKPCCNKSAQVAPDAPKAAGCDKCAKAGNLEQAQGCGNCAKQANAQQGCGNCAKQANAQQGCGNCAKQANAQQGCGNCAKQANAQQGCGNCAKNQQVEKKQQELN